MHKFSMSTSSTYFFQITHAEKKGLAGSHYEWITPQEHPGCDLLVPKNFYHDGSWYWKNEISRTSRTIAKVTNILRELANTYPDEVSRMNLGLKNPEIECLLTKWHHGMLSRMVARIITLGTQNMARLLGDSL